MKVIIAGSRDIEDYAVVEKAINDSGFEITSVISGTARGVDLLGEKYAKTNNIPILRFPANWNLYGKSAGYRRNQEMSKNADALIAIRLNNSKGTSHMIDIARKDGLKVYVLDFVSIDEGYKIHTV
jgi:hypothetical protein